MRQVILTQSADAASEPVPLDLYLTPFQVTIVTKVTGVVAYALQYSYDNPFTVAAADMVWFDDTAAPAGTTAAAQTSYDNPVAAVRINKAAGPGSVQATITQAGAR